MKLFLKVLKGLGLFKMIVWVINRKECWSIHEYSRKESEIMERKESKRLKSFFLFFFSLLSGWAWVWLWKNPQARVEGSTISNYYEGDPYFENLEPLEISFFIIVLGCVFLLEYVRPDLDEDWMNVLWGSVF